MADNNGTTRPPFWRSLGPDSFNQLPVVGGQRGDPLKRLNAVIGRLRHENVEPTECSAADLSGIDHCGITIVYAVRGLVVRQRLVFGLGGTCATRRLEISLCRRAQA